MARLVRLLTLWEISISRTINKSQSSTKTGEVAPGDNTRTRGKNTAGKPPRPSGRQVNSEEQWIFNVYVLFSKLFFLQSTIVPFFVVVVVALFALDVVGLRYLRLFPGGQKVRCLKFRKFSVSNRKGFSTQAKASFSVRTCSLIGRSKTYNNGSSSQQKINKMDVALRLLSDVDRLFGRRN